MATISQSRRSCLRRAQLAAGSLGRRLYQDCQQPILGPRAGRTVQPPGNARQDGRRRRVSASELLRQTQLDCRAVTAKLYLRPGQRNSSHQELNAATGVNIYFCDPCFSKPTSTLNPLHFTLETALHSASAKLARAHCSICTRIGSFIAHRNASSPISLT
jgi:hypothetical protein